MPLLILLARRSWRTLLIATLTGLVCGLSAAGLIAVINDGISRIQQLQSTDVATYIVLAALVILSRIFADIGLIKLGQTAVNDLRIHLSHRLIDTPYRKLQQLGKHRLLAMLTDDTQTISQAIEYVPILLVNSGIIVACLAYLGWLNPQLLLLTILLIALGAATFNLPQRKAIQSLSKARELKDGLFQHYRSLSDGTKELQLNQNRRQQFFNEMLEPTSETYKKDFIRGLSIYALVLNWGNGLFYVLIGLVLYVAPKMIALEPILVTGYILTILYMITPLSELMNALPVLGRASIALKKIEALESQLANEVNINESDSTNLAISKTADLSCKSVSHTYFREQEDGKFTLGPFDLSLHSGEMVFITGGNGGGKTTLALLLTGLYQPEEGDILLNNSISCREHSQQFRQHFTAIFTDFCLFENLLDSNSPVLISRANEYLSHLQLDHKVSIRNGKLSTMELSTGQRKRLALLAAYLEDRPCYLFDEWAADQDPIFKQFFYTKILPDLKRLNKLVIAVTHDDAYFHLADRLIKVDQGKVVEQVLPPIIQETLEPTPVL